MKSSICVRVSVLLLEMFKKKLQDYAPKMWKRKSSRECYRGFGGKFFEFSSNSEMLRLVGVI